MNLLLSLFKARRSPQARACYIAAVTAGRNPFFYTNLGVPDSLDGRFELMALHVFFLEDRMKDEQPDFARDVSEYFIADLDTALREQGIGDSGVKRRIAKMGKAYHGRLQVYAEGLKQGADALRTCLARNLYGTVTEGDVMALAAMADYVMQVQAQLVATPTPVILGGGFIWPQPQGTRQAA